MSNAFVKKWLSAFTFILASIIFAAPSLCFASPGNPGPSSTVAGGSAGDAAPASSATGTARTAAPQALFVPIDDRPSTYIFPPQIARIAGGQLQTPQRYLLGKLNKPGDKEKVAQWLIGTPAETAIISADMLCYGGLIASRTSATSQREAITSLDTLVKCRAQGKELRVFAIIPRLSLRTSDKNAQYEQALLNWASSGAVTPPAHIPAEAVEEYRMVRNRNIEVIKELIKLTREQTISQLTIGQDDSASKGLHVKEQQELADYIEEMGVGN
ncbi:MAG: DUF4127 family protein, partial [bacterium]|nr:DUF4127 family protein [bacterium]